MQPHFADVAEEFLEFIDAAQLVIHNADFDVAFIDHELARLESSESSSQHIAGRCEILDTLALARRMHPGQRNSLDALAKRYEVDNSKRALHGALLDARILAEVYLAMTGGQASLSLGGLSELAQAQDLAAVPVERDGLELCVLQASPEERVAHEAMLVHIRERSGEPSLWEAWESTD